MALGTVVSVVFTACGGNDDQSAVARRRRATEAPADIGDESLTGADGAATAPEAAVPSADSPAGALGDADLAGTDLSNLGRDIVIEMHVTMTSDDLRRTVQGIIARRGGARRCSVSRPTSTTASTSPITVMTRTTTRP